MADNSSLLPEMFSGDNPQDAERFIFTLRRYISYRGIQNEAKKADLFLLRLSGQAFLWASALPENQTFDQLAAAFQARYLPHDIMKFRFAKEVFETKQSNVQSVDDYISKLKKVGTLADANEQTLIYAAMNGLLPHILNRVIDKGYSTMDELLKNARFAEALHSLQNVEPVVQPIDKGFTPIGASEAVDNSFEMRELETEHCRILSEGQSEVVNSAIYESRGRFYTPPQPHSNTPDYMPCDQHANYTDFGKGWNVNPCSQPDSSRPSQPRWDRTHTAVGSRQSNCQVFSQAKQSSLQQENMFYSDQHQNHGQGQMTHPIARCTRCLSTKHTGESPLCIGRRKRCYGCQRFGHIKIACYRPSIKFQSNNHPQTGLGQ